MHEAYLEQGLIVKDAKKLRIHYAKNRSCPKTKYPYLDNQRHTIKMYENPVKIELKTSFQRRLTFVLDMISVLPTDLFFFYTGVACHEQVDPPLVLSIFIFQCTIDCAILESGIGGSGDPRRK